MAEARDRGCVQNGLVTISVMITATTSSAARALRTPGSRSAVRKSGVTSPRALASASACSNTLPCGRKTVGTRDADRDEQEQREQHPPVVRAGGG